MKLLPFILIFIINNIAAAAIVPVPLLYVKDLAVKSSKSPDGSNRRQVKLTLPANASGIIYLITVRTSGKSEPANLLPLISQVAKSNKEDADQIAQEIVAPAGASAVNVYVMADDENDRIFSLGQTPAYIKEQSRVADFSGGTIALRLPPAAQSRDLWIGIENPSETTRIIVSLEAVALMPAK